MKKIFYKIVNKFFELQEKFLKAKYQAKMKAFEHAGGKMSKSGLAPGASLTLSVELEKNKEKINKEVRQLIEENKDNLENLLFYAKDRGAKSYLFKNSKTLLKPVFQAPGLIFPQKGLKALYLNLLTERKFSFKTGALFIFENEKISTYNLLYNFYKWYAYINSLPGFDEAAVSSLQNLSALEAGQNIEKMNYKEIISLKEAIARDKEAMEFVLSFMKETEGSKNAFDVMKNKEDGANI